MSRKFLTYGFGAIALYLVVFYGANSGKVITSATTGAGTVIKSFQGR
jgi:hypothetical protein